MFDLLFWFVLMNVALGGAPPPAEKAPIAAPPPLTPWEKDCKRLLRHCSLGDSHPISMPPTRCQADACKGLITWLFCAEVPARTEDTQEREPKE